MMGRWTWLWGLLGLAVAWGCGDSKAGSVCGNGVAEPGEECDGVDVRGLGCADFGLGGIRLDLACSADCRFDTSGCREPECGNGVAEPGEDCDGTDVRGESCATIGFGFLGGTLGCQADCRYDVTGCTVEGGGEPPDCGDGVATGYESCDGTDIRGKTCGDLVGYKGGELACKEDCSFDTSGCEPTVCGDGVLDNDEQCDGSELGGQSCETVNLNFSGGQLGCGTDCRYDYSGCMRAAVCGNGKAEGGEECDGDDLRQLQCFMVGYDYGVITCGSDCRLDVSTCTGDPCEIHGLYGNGICDACEEYGGHHDPDCDACGQADGRCSPPDRVDEFLKVSTCQVVTGARDPDCGVCGDGIRSAAEVCDGTDVGQWKCRDFGYAVGQVGCSADCELDLSGCEGFCGDNVRQTGEACDGFDLDVTDCEELELGTGRVFCSDRCRLDVTHCTDWQRHSVCGDGLAHFPEVCDGDQVLYTYYTCELFGFAGGTLRCRDGCLLDVSECSGDWCALNGAYGDGKCDDCEVNGEGHYDPDCDACGQADGRCSPPDQRDFYGVETACEVVTGARDPDCGVCGDGLASDVEECDGTDLHGADCTDFGYSGGTLRCTEDCRFLLWGCQD